MTDTPRTVIVPPPRPGVFTSGISHPDLWLWDSWIHCDGASIDLYCLALARTDVAGDDIQPAQRNEFPFHIRHFSSVDGGQSWRDCGAVLVPGQTEDGSDVRNVWSGSVLKLADGRVLHAYTGIRHAGPQRQFVQSLCLAVGRNPSATSTVQPSALSCPLRDYDAITAAGYYLGPRDALGMNAGEETGPILAWRDPFLIAADDGTLHMFWSAKVSATEPCIGHGVLSQIKDGFELSQLCAPIRLPDAQRFTQAEVPKLYRDSRSGLYFLIISACDRLFEGQDDSEVSKVHHLYVANALTGKWQAWHQKSSRLDGLDGLFGGSLVNIEMTPDAQLSLSILAPYTEQASAAHQLSFAPIQHIMVPCEVETQALSASNR